jgi:hypothetical protein
MPDWWCGSCQIALRGDNARYVARVGARSPAVLAYELTSEPVLFGAATCTCVGLTAGGPVGGRVGLR